MKTIKEYADDFFSPSISEGIQAKELMVVILILLHSIMDGNTFQKHIGQMIMLADISNLNKKSENI